MTISFKSFKSAIRHILPKKYPIMLRGRHGVGKSELVYQLAKEMVVEVVERRVSQMTDGDIIGLPVFEDGKTKWIAPDFFQHACENPVYLFFDELDRGDPHVRQSIMEITDSRKMNGYRLHPDTIVFASCNGGINTSQYEVNDLDPAELDRWAVFDVEPTVQDWLDYADGKVTPQTYNFISLNHDHLEHKSELEPGKVYPSRRSWFRLDQCLRDTGLLTKKNATSKDSPFLNLASGFVGMEAALAFQEFLREQDDIVEPSMIIDDGNFQLVEGFMNNEHISLVDRIKKSNILKNGLTDKQLKNYCHYFSLLPSEIATVLWHHMGLEVPELSERCSVESEVFRKKIMEIF